VDNAGIRGEQTGGGDACSPVTLHSERSTMRPRSLPLLTLVLWSLMLTGAVNASDTAIVSPESVGISSDRLARLTRVLQEEVEQKRKAGIVALIARNGQTAYLQAAGIADLASGRKMQPDNYFRLYSMTKPVTSVALLMLYEEGKFQLDDPLDKYLPAFANVKVYIGEEGGKRQLADVKRKITVHDVFRHTAGFAYGLGAEPLDDIYRKGGLDLDKLTSLRELTDKLAAMPLLYQPGERWVYSVSHDVQARLVEVLSGMRFDEFVLKRIAGPLGMKDTFFGIPADRAARFANIYGPDDRGGLQLVASADRGSAVPVTNYKRFTDLPFGGHSLSSTISDYARFAQMLVNGGELDGVRILGRKTVELMTSDHLPAGVAGPAPGLRYGLGVWVMSSPAENGNLGSRGQFGWSGAATTHVVMDPTEKLVAILCAQHMPIDFPFMERFETLAYQALTGD
jgi:CubicO group peptidase (beta-lactamase class C family)